MIKHRTYLLFALFCLLLLGNVSSGTAQDKHGEKAIQKNVLEQGDAAQTNAHYQITIFKQQGQTLKRLFFAFGFNNVVGSNLSPGDSYKFLGSRFFEIGGEFSTALTPTGFYRLNYGLAFQFNGLKPKDNRFFKKNGSKTRLVKFPSSLEKSKFRRDHLVLPVHFEFGPADLDYQARSWRVGVGGYSGLRIGIRQKLRYKEDGKTRREKSAQRLNTPDFIYGLSAYLGYGKTALYVKYDLNPIFKHNPVAEHNISLGLRITLY